MTAYPDLSGSRVISLDIETYDPGLTELGPGVYRRDGNILGVGISNGDFSEYYDVGHKGIDGGTKARNLSYVREVMRLPCKKLGAKVIYDLDWLENWAGIEVRGEIHDIQIAEALIDENQGRYGLDFLSGKYLGRGKAKGEIEDFCGRRGLKGDPRKWLWMMGHELVRKYNRADVENPIEIFKLQWDAMRGQDLLGVYHLEIALIPLLLQMRRQGVRVSRKKVEEGILLLRNLVRAGTRELHGEYGEFNFNSSRQVAKVFDGLGIRYPLTKKGNPNINKEVLEYVGHPVAGKILRLKEAARMLSAFFINSFSNHSVGGRIHCSFNQLKEDGYGAVSGRFSSSDPNLQQVPVRKEVYGELCRSVFIPEEGCWWGRTDLNQIEYRLIAHYAVGEKSDEVRRQYNENPGTDYHALIMEWTGEDRKTSKNLNFGIAYALGRATMARKFGYTLGRAQDLIANYNAEVPFVRSTRSHVVNIAKGRGYIRTILGRRARVTQEMRDSKREYSMFNRLIQGSAADLLKKAMVDCYEAGIFNVLFPHLTVHDELDSSIPKTKEGIEAFNEQKFIMENCVKLKVPIMADSEIGGNWGQLRKYDPKQLELCL